MKQLAPKQCSFNSKYKKFGMPFFHRFLVAVALILPLSTVQQARAESLSVSTVNLGANQVTLQVSTDTAGTGFFTLLNDASASCGTVEQTIAGQSNGGTIAYRHGSFPLAAGAANSYTVSNLLARHGYTACIASSNSSTATISITTKAEWNLNGSNWQYVGSAGFTSTIALEEQLAFAPDGTPWVGYLDDNPGAQLAMKYSGANGWQAVGPATSDSYGEYLSWAMAPDGTPWVAYSDHYQSWKVTVKKYDSASNTWVVVGTAGFTSGRAANVHLAFAPDETPWVAYQDLANGNKASVMKLDKDSNTWVNAGAAGFSSGIAFVCGFAFAPDGSPWIAFVDFANGQHATVMKYDATSNAWIAAGAKGFTPNPADIQSLGFAPDGTPWLIYVDEGAEYHFAASRYDYASDSWISVAKLADDNLVDDENYNASLAFAPDGAPWVAYTNSVDKAIVVKYDASSDSWTSAGVSNITDGPALFLSLAFSPQGIPSYVCLDYNKDYKASMVGYVPVTLATTANATNLTSSSATLNGTVESGSWDARVSYDYGTTTSYGTSVAATTVGANSGNTIAAQSGPTATSAEIRNLAPNTTYHFRVTISNSDTTTYGADNSFTTDVATPVVSNWPSAAAISYGQTLASATLSGGTATDGSTAVAGSFAWQDATIAPTAGTHSYTVIFTPADTNDYNTVSNTVTVTVNRAVPTVTAMPSAATISYGQTLASATLSGGTATDGSTAVAGSFAWQDATIAPAAGTHSYTVIFTPADTNDYNTVSNTVTVTVNRAVPTVTTVPAASSLILGQTLASSTLSGGAAVNPYTQTAVAGSFAWSNSNTAATAGNAIYNVLFTPTDASNYSPATTSVNLYTQDVLATTTGISAESNQVMLGSNVKLSVVVAANTGTPTGTVRLLDGSSVIGNASLSGGQASFSISTLPAGTHLLTASYVGSDPYTASSSTGLSVTIIDVNAAFTADGGTSGTSMTTTVNPGGNVDLVLAITSEQTNTLPVQTTLSVTGLPSGATATLSGDHWTAISSTSWGYAAGIALSNPTLHFGMPRATSAASRDGKRFAPLALALLLFPFSTRLRKSSRRAWMLLLVLMFGLFTGLTGCTASNGYFGQSVNNYTVTITLTSGSVSKVTTLHLTEN